MKSSILNGVVLATLGVTIGSPLASPDTESVAAAANSTQILAGWQCYLDSSPPGGGSIPCRAGANTGYDIVTYYSIGWTVDVYCKANGGTYHGYNVWDYIDRAGNNCWINSYHTNSGCETPVRWC